jgi:translation initiation factor 2A
LDAETGEVLMAVEGRPVQAVAFSPRGSFLLTWERPAKETPPEGGAPEGNLVVWRVLGGERLISYQQRVFKKTDWPTVQWTSDEALCYKVRQRFEPFAPLVGSWPDQFP